MNPTASSLARVIACPSSESLPHQQSHSEFAAAGTSRHLFLELLGKVGREEALAAVPEEHREECSQIDTEGLPNDLACEVAFAWDWVTGEARELGRGMGRDYSDCTETEICGTIDVLGLSEDSLLVSDYKGPRFVKTAGNPQLLFAAMCAAKAYKRNSATMEIIGIQGSSNRRFAVEVDEFDLADFEYTLKGAIEMMLAIKEGRLTPNYNQGPHCQYCPAFHSCPAKTRLMLAMIEQPEQAMITAENASEAYEKYLRMREIMKVVTSAIHAYAKETPIDIGDGRVFGSREKLGNEKLDGAVAHAVLVEQLGREFADVACSFSVSKKGIAAAAKAAKAAGAEGTLKALGEGVMDAVRFKGGASRKSGTVVDEHKATK